MIESNIMGIGIINPLIIAPGPWSRGKEGLKKALTCGAGAVITESIVSEAYSDLSPRYAYNRVNRGVQNIRLYSAIELEAWIKALLEVDKENRYSSDTRLIASVMGISPSEVAYVARKVEKTGVDGIEVGIACPMGEGPEIIAGDPVKVYDYIKAVVDTVSVPVSVKLSAATGNLPMVVKACNKAGASGISGIDTIRCILGIDVESNRPSLATYGGYSGAPIRPIGLSTIAGIAQSTNLPITGIGGIENYVNALEYIMAGASAVGIGSEILLRGYNVVGEVLDGLDKWLAEHGITDVNQIRGKALSYLKSFEEIKPDGRTARVIHTCRRADCLECMDGCLDEAISFDGNIVINNLKCTGCGLCVDKCLDKCLDSNIELMWK